MRLVRIVDGYLSPELLSRVRGEHGRALAQYLIQFIPLLMSRNEYRLVARIYRDAIWFSHDPKTLYRLLQYTRNHRKLLEA